MADGSPFSASSPSAFVTTLDDWTARRIGVAGPLTRDAVESYQLARLRDLVTRVRRDSPFYRDQAGWPDGGLATLADLARLPFTTPDDLARHDPPLLAVAQSAVARIVTLPTSGTSGLPKRVFCAEEDLEDTVDFFRHGMALFTRPGDRVVIAFPATRPGSVGDGLAEAVRRLGALPILADPEAPVEDLVALLRAERPEVVFGTPVRLLAAARLGATDGGTSDNKPAIAPRAVLLSADRVPDSLRRALTGLWRCAVHVHWGMTETGLGGALECSAHDGMHLRESDLLVEIVDPDCGLPLPLGAVGEIVVTTLRRHALPLLRYRTGDRGRLLPDRCACGSVLRRLGHGVERLRAARALPGGGSLTLAALDEALFALDAVTDVAATLEDGPPARLSLTVATPSGLRNPATRAAMLATARERLAALPELAGPLSDGTLTLAVELADATTCRHAGKRRLAEPAPTPDTPGAPVRRTDWPRAVLFDLDGTLIDSVGDVRDALNEALASVGAPPLPLDAVRRILGGGGRALIARALAFDDAVSPERLDAALTRFLALYRPPPLRHTKACPGAAETLRQLGERGVARAVVTNKGEADSRAALSHTGLDGMVDLLIGGDSGPPKKPDPGLFLLACRRLGVEPARAVAVGDGDDDVAAAIAGGFPCIAVRGGCSRGGLDTLGATRVIGSLHELPAALLWINDGERRSGSQ